MPTVEESPCPNCGAEPGALTIEHRLRAKPVGSYSLAGAQMKFSATSVPVLCCSACGLRREGSWDGDGRHVTFGPDPDDETLRRCR